VVLGRKLADTEGAAWAGQTLPAQFEQLAAPDYRVLNLGINGLLFSDLECVTRDVLARGVGLLVLNVSPRPFSTDFDVPHPSSERAFLCSGPGGVPIRPATVERALPVLRYRDLLQTAFLGRSLPQVVAERLELAFRRPAAADDDDRELQEAIRRLRAAQRYNSISITPAHAQAIALDRLLRVLVEATSVPIVVFYLQENVSDIQDQLDLPHYEKERRAFIALLQRRLSGVAHVRLAIVSREDVGDAYVDQVHPSPAGYRRLAERLRVEALALLRSDAGR
jgi:lysophospholipase L1-like esterase